LRRRDTLENAENSELQFGIFSGNAGNANFVVHRGVTEGTPRSPCTKAYRAVAKRRNAYAAMPLEMLGTPTFKLACSPVFEMKKDTAHATLKCGVPKEQKATAGLQSGTLAGNANFAVHRGVTKGTPRFAFCPFLLSHDGHVQKGIVPSQKKEALTQRYP